LILEFGGHFDADEWIFQTTVRLANLQVQRIESAGFCLQERIVTVRSNSIAANTDFRMEV